MKIKKDFIKSPLDSSVKARLTESIFVEGIINGYKNQLSINVRPYFKEITEVCIYECERTKYRFYYPFTIGGDNNFYQNLQQFDWYYNPWKWEQETANSIIKITDKILEVGCGGLGFIEKMNNFGYDITGLELNKDSIYKAKKLDLKVIEESVETHSIKNFEKYDIVCSFQVLEHISDVHSFLKANIDCIKSGGKLIISVPNNNSFIKLSKNLYLNMPPHHMGLWNKFSLESLPSLFNIKLEKIKFEPLADYHLDWYVNLNIQERINKNKFSKIIFNRLKLKRSYTYLITKMRRIIHGHTILVIYRKV